MRTRFHALIDSLRPDLAHVSYLSIGNEVDPYLSSHPAEWATYKAFLTDAIAYVHSVAPSVKVGVTATFDGANGAAAADVAALNAASDVYILTYYPLTGDFGVRPPDAPLTDLPRMVSLAGVRPLILQEVGYPASTLLGSSEQLQAQFVTNVFDAWGPRGDRIPFLNVFLMHDFPQTLCDYFTQYYGLPGNERFSQFLCTLGLRKANGTPRLAWTAFVDAGRKVSAVR
jgi:hypothetical protein